MTDESSGSGSCPSSTYIVSNQSAAMLHREVM